MILGYFSSNRFVVVVFFTTRNDCNVRF